MCSLLAVADRPGHPRRQPRYEQTTQSGSGLYQRSLAPSDHGDNTPQIIDDRGNKSYRGRWPATPLGADQEGNGGGVVGCGRRRWLHRGRAELAEFTGFLPVRSLRGYPVGTGLVIACRERPHPPSATGCVPRTPVHTRSPLSLWFSMGFQPTCAVRCRSSHSDDHQHVPGMDGSASAARQVTFTLIDDTDGSPAAETVSFGLDGRQYVIDLSAAHAIQLRDVLASYLPAARRGSGSTSRRRSPSRPAGNREQTAAIRQWARANGQPVSDRGRISQAVLHAYENRDSVPAPVEIAAPTKKARKRSNKTAS